MHLVDPRELIGQKEAVELSGISKRGFQLARTDGRVPEPIAVLACGPIWVRRQFDDWVADRAARRP